MFSLASSAFAAMSLIPSTYTCEGVDFSPPLEWSGAPEGTKSFALIVDDPDAPDPAAPKVVWVHWILFNIPRHFTSLPEKVVINDVAPEAVEGVNGWGHGGWNGPCPPIGKHRYFFKLYALDSMLNLGDRTDKEDLLKAMEGHILGEAELIGTYEKTGE